MSKARKKLQNSKTQSRTPVWILAIVALAAVALIAIWMVNRGNAPTAELPSEISVSEAFAKREAGAFILDVRQPEEWQEYHVPGSTLIPLGELEGRVDELPRDQEIVVVCRSGNRSQAGRDTLKQAGFSEVTSMTGGVSEWRASGYPTETGN
jgi:rhodanese-related sulfurtransferase